jgi:anti-sigma B factor antagonist
MTSFFISEDETEAAPHGEAVLVAGGELDYEGSPRLRHLMFEAITPGTRRVVLDLSEATFIDSTAIGVLVGAATRLHELGGSLAVVCANENVLRIFEIAGIDSMLTLYGSRDEAFARPARAG